MKEAYIVAGVRTAVGKASKGALKNFRPDELGAIVLKEVIKRVPGLAVEDIEDVVMGNSFPEAEQGMNLARVCSLRAGFPGSVPGVTVNRFCSSGLQAIAIGAEAIKAWGADVIIASGVESMSIVPSGGHSYSPNPYLTKNYPGSQISMGLTAEEVASRFKITREEQDEFSYYSHKKAIAAITEGRFKDEIIPVKVSDYTLNEKENLIAKELVFDTDEGPRAGTTIEVLSKLKPVFKIGGTVTAGNSSQTSDGAAAVLLISENKSKEMNVKPMGVLRSFAVSGVDPEIMGVGPAYAIPKALKKANLSLDQIDLFELNEAFASQALYCIKKLEIDPNKINVNGGAIALGHPLGCTGTKLTIQLLNEMDRRNLKYGVVSMCIGGGMGAAAVIEKFKN